MGVATVKWDVKNYVNIPTAAEKEFIKKLKSTVTYLAWFPNCIIVKT